MNGLVRPGLVYLIAALSSLLLSFYAATHVDVVNPDAICYLQSASTMSEGLQIARHLCGQASWPLYPGLIYGVSQLTHLDVTTAAYCLNSIFSLISVLTFIAIVQKISARPLGAILWLAAAVILLAHEFNALRQDVIRDHGFMAFYLLSILFLLNYFYREQWRFSLGWSASLVIATLFRIEGGVFLLLLPFLVFLDRRFALLPRIKLFFKLQLPIIIVASLLGVWLLMHPSQDVSRLHELQYHSQYAWSLVSHRFFQHAHALATTVLTPDSARDANIVFLLTMLSWYLIQVITAVSAIYAFLIIYAWYKRVLVTNSSMRLVLWGYVFINIIITFVFLAERYFLSKRYLMPLSLVLMIWVPFAIHYLLQHYRQRKWIPVTVLVLILLSSLGGIFHFGYPKKYITDAGEWVSKNVPSQSKLYSNDIQFKYYSKHFGNAIFEKHPENDNLKKLNWCQFDYLALRLNKHDPGTNEWVKKEIHFKPIKSFENQRGDQVVIYKVPH